jgi:hypothetical protein
MLLDKYQWQQHRERHSQEERIQRDEDHQRCPFFIFCWNEELRLPSADNYPECNGPREEHRSSKRQYLDGHGRQLIGRDRCEEKCVPIHDQLGCRVNIHDRLEDMANDRVPDEEPLNREIEHQRTYRYDSKMYTQWCPGGLTKFQKRRVQRLCHRELEKERTQEKKQVRSQVWCVKQKADETAPSASINMVFILPMEFKAPTDDEEAEEQAMAQQTVDPMPATFDKPEEKEHRHLRPLYIKGHVDGQPMTRMLVDGGAAVNVMPYTTYYKLRKGKEDLIKTDMMPKDFEGKVSTARGGGQSMLN